MHKTNVERCKTCLIPKSSNVTFDDDGICNICKFTKQQSLPKQYKPKNEITDCIRKIKNLGESRPYDCLVGISGGRDSSYLLYQLVNTDLENQPYNRCNN